MHGWKLPARNLDQVLWFLRFCHWPISLSLCTEFLRRDTDVFPGRCEYQPSGSGPHGSGHLRLGRILGSLVRAPDLVVTTISLQVVVCLRARCIQEGEPTRESGPEATFHGNIDLLSDSGDLWHCGD